MADEPLDVGLRVLKLEARGETFRIVQVRGNLFVCSPANGNCCCGRPEKGRMAFENSLYESEWERRRLRSRLHLTFSGCLGPCAVGNNAMLQILGRSIWFKDLNDRALVPQLFDYAEAILAAGRILTPPEGLAPHVYERYLPPPEGGYEPFSTCGMEDTGGLDHLDPVCLMDVDPTTARHWVDYGGSRVYFCAPACKKLFLASPKAYIAR